MMRSKWLIALAVVAFLASAASAAQTLTLQSWVTGYYTNGTGSVHSIAPTKTITTFISTTTQYRIDFKIQLADVPADRSFGNVTFNIGLPVGTQLTDSTTPSSRAYWQKDTTSFSYVNEEENTIQVPIWSSNKDAGPSATDLQAVLVEVGQDAGELTNDSRLNIGIGSAQKVGSVFVRWDGTLVHMATTKGAGQPWSLLNYTAPEPGGTYVVQTAASMIVGPDLTFGVPEPATMVLLALGGLLSLRRRR